MAKRENQECTASVKTEEGSRGVALTAWKTAKDRQNVDTQVSLKLVDTRGFPWSDGHKAVERQGVEE